MNCKPGDLAIIKGPCLCPENEGKIVTVVRLANANEYYNDSGKTSIVWIVEGHNLLVHCLDTYSGKAIRIDCVNTRPMADQWLKPIRFSDGEDETFQWAGKPKEISNENQKHLA